MSSTTSTSSKPSKKTRVARRRGPIRNDDIEEEPIERAALSDTESEPTDSEVESEDEIEEEEGVQKTTTVPPLDADSSTTNRDTTISDPPSKESSQHLWSDSLALDKPSADENLPVIDFADLSLIAEPGDSAPKDKEAEKGGGPVAPVPERKAKVVPAHVQARQTYLQKLNSDPSFTPRVGQFWGHDDRLLDKDLRGMSDWWKGRWQNRGRGRGGRGGFGRGRGGGAGGRPEPDPQPVEEKWTHDGYEEMMKNDDATKRNNRFRGKERRGGFRGGAPPTLSSSQAAANQPSPKPSPSEIQSRLQAQAAAKMASEQQQAASSTPSTPTAVSTTQKAPKRGNPRNKLNAVLAQAAKDRERSNAQSVVAVAKGEVAAEKEKAQVEGGSDSLVTMETPPTTGVKVNLPRHLRRANAPTESNGPSKPAPRRASARTESLEKVILKDSFTKTTSSGAASEVAPSPSASQGPFSVNAPQPPFVTSQPPFTTLPSANNSYSYVNLPQGIAMGDSGLLYEVATGRPVVLNQPNQPTNITPPLPPPPISVYDPRTVLHPHAARPFIPTPPTMYSPPPPQVQGTTPTFFTPPRQSGPVQIRPPVSSSKDQEQQRQQQQHNTYHQQTQAQQQQPPYESYYGTTYYNGQPPSSAPPQPYMDDPYYSSYYAQPPYGYPVDYTNYGQGGSAGRNDNAAPYTFDGRQRQQSISAAQQSQQVYY